MIPRALTVLIERSIVWTRKTFLMGEFVRKSLEELELAIDEAIAHVDLGQKVGIFGIGDSANVVHRQMVAHGCPEVFFIATNPQKESHRGCPLVDFDGDEIYSADVIICSSLSNSMRQKELLLERNFKGEIITLKNFSHISTIISNDASTYKLIERLQGIHAGRSRTRRGWRR